MNLLVVQERDFLDRRRVRLEGRRARHISEVLRAREGQELRLGLRDGCLGWGRVVKLTAEAVELDVQLQAAAPPPLPLSLVLALPRPKMLRRILQGAAALGVRDMILINALRVEKSFWQSPYLAPAALEEQFLLGLEQSGSTWMPQLRLVRRFKPFVEDELPALAAGRRALVAHPYAHTACPRASNQETLLAIGPEGGFIDYEIGLLEGAGLRSFSLGPRILRVETVLPLLVGRLF